MNNPLASLPIIAAADIGLHEDDNSNAGSEILKFQRATNLGGQGWPWCAAAVDYWVREFLLRYPGIAAITLNSRPVTAAAFGLLDWGEANDCLIITQDQIPPYHPMPGDIVVYTFSHCGIVSSEIEEGVFEAIEGNTDGSGSRDGGEVARRTRSVKLVKALIRMPVEALAVTQSAGAPPAAGMAVDAVATANGSGGTEATGTVADPTAKSPGDTTDTGFSAKALRLILDAEGLDQPRHWPGGGSGITLGIGYDIGYVTVKLFQADWGDLLPDDQVERLSTAVGLKGSSARMHAGDFNDINISRDIAEKVFKTRTLKAYIKQTSVAFPGMEKLPNDAQGALVSLVYNRGPGMDGDPRAEMRAVREAVAKGDLGTIADQIIAMKRLWVGKGLDGLLKRRDAEATLVRSCLPA